MLNIPDCRSALASLLQVDIARLSVEQGTPAANRRQGRSTRRDTVNVDGVPTYSVKWYPSDHDRKLDEIAGLQTVMREQVSIRTPIVVGELHVGSFRGLVEEWVGNLQTLADALSIGRIQPEDGQVLVESLFKTLCSREFPDGGVRERDRARCIDALKWAGQETEEYQTLRAWVENELPPTPAKTVLIHEDLIPQNIFIDTEGQPLLVDFDLCHYTTIPWFAVWRNAHLTGSPRRFWPTEWASSRPDLLFRMCSLLETQLQSEVLDPVQFVVDRDKGWLHHNHQLSRQLEEARQQQRSLDQTFAETIASRIATTNEATFSNIRARIEEVLTSFREALAGSHRSEIEALRRHHESAVQHQAEVHRHELEAQRDKHAGLQHEARAQEHALNEQINELRQACQQANSEKAVMAAQLSEAAKQAARVYELHQQLLHARDSKIDQLAANAREHLAETLRLQGQLDQERKALAAQQANHHAAYERQTARARRTASQLRAVLPLVSVIIVTKDGRRFLPGVLDALQLQTYPNLEVVLVDNGSSDDSCQFVSEQYPEVRIIRAKRNLGFAGGNNLGAQHATGDYLAFLNNDTIPHEDWLAELVQTAHSSRDIGAVGSKILFLTRFIQLEISAPPFQPSAAGVGADERLLGIALDLSSRVSNCDYDKLIFTRGFHGEENWDGRKVRWSAPEAMVLLPVPETPTATLDLKIRGFGPDDHRQVSFRLPSGQVFKHPAPGEFASISIPLDSAALDSSTYVINNAASRLDEHGNAGDRGIFEPDQGQYDTIEDVTSLCGCSMLIRRAVFSQIGGFDERYFMYYEDTDLCWRLRRAGFRLVYQPKSVVRHVHAGSSVEWSPFFRFHVVRNHRFIKAKNLAWRHLWPEIKDRNQRLHTLKKQFGTRLDITMDHLGHLAADEIEYLALISSRATYDRILLARLRPSWASFQKSEEQ